MRNLIGWGLVAMSATACNFSQGVLTKMATNSQGQQNSPPTNSVGTGTAQVKVSWAANREKAVNSAGGGYRVYYSTSSTLDGSTPFVNVPWVSGDSPTSVELTGLPTGTFYLSVVAFSAINPTGSTAARTTVVVK